LLIFCVFLYRREIHPLDSRLLINYFHISVFSCLKFVLIEQSPEIGSSFFPFLKAWWRPLKSGLHEVPLAVLRFRPGDRLLV